VLCNRLSQQVPVARSDQLLWALLRFSLLRSSSVSPLALPVAGSSSPNSIDSIACRDSLSGSPRTSRCSHRRCPLRPCWLSHASSFQHTPLGYVIRLGMCHDLILVSKLVHATSQTTPPHRSTSITEASTLLSVALELTLSIGILPHGLHRLSFPSVALGQSSRVPQNSL
jgi:hypothetical protein